MQNRYEIDGLMVCFTPWHSEALDEDFIAVSVRRDGMELFHSGMTKLVPSEEQARHVVEALVMVERALKRREVE